jgi:uncharacterized protein (DUF2235 family)
MPRQLVVCLDGTNNRFSHRPTNVVRTYRSLQRDPARVLAWYDQGVGTFGLKETLFEWQKTPARVAGLAFGWGLVRTVDNAYRFLCNCHEPGDEIFVFGFSRGAYAARALAALVHATGLLQRHELHLAEYAWSMLLARDAEGRPDFRLQAKFKATFGRAARIRLLGLYDTVKSVGWIYDPVVIPYTADNSSVDAVRHAVAIDERRCFFRQHLWAAEHSAKTNVKEVWFAGVHSDVGGGYPPGEAALALVAQTWMMGEARTAGLLLDAKRTALELQAAKGVRADPLAKMHDSMSSTWKMAEWLPRRIWIGPDSAKAWQIGAMPPFGQPRPRFMPAGAARHRSVEIRQTSGSIYAPPNLADDGPVVDDDATLAPWLDASAYAEREKP